MRSIPTLTPFVQQVLDRDEARAPIAFAVRSSLEHTQLPRRPRSSRGVHAAPPAGTSAQSIVCAGNVAPITIGDTMLTRPLPPAPAA